MRSGTRIRITSFSSIPVAPYLGRELGQRNGMNDIGDEGVDVHEEGDAGHACDSVQVRGDRRDFLMLGGAKRSWCVVIK